MNELMALLVVHEVRQTLSPRVLEFNQNLNKFDIVFELWIDHFYILLVFFEKGSEISKRFLYPLGKGTNCLGLVWTNPTEDSFSSQENIIG